MLIHRSFRGLVDGASLRTAVYDGEEHLVVPIIALVEGVIHASNSSGPELVLAEEFSKVPQGWDGRPVMANHPIIDGNAVSANNPPVLDKRRFGHVFNARVKNKKLLMDAFLSPEHAEKVGEEATGIVERIKNSETVEVSVGVFVLSEEVEGTYEGEEYTAIWRDIVPDHLAMLPEGIAGACDADMGCGAPRAASSGGGDVSEAKKPWKERFTEFLSKFKASAETSDNDLRMSLDDALRAVEPGYLGIDAVYPDSNQVVYAVYPEDELQLFRRSFESDGEGKIKLGKGREEVRQVMTYEPVTAAAAGSGTSGTPAPTPPASEDRGMTDKNKERVAAIIASGKTCFAEADVTYMETFDDERLTALEKRIKPEPTPEPAAAAAPPAPAPEPNPNPEADPAPATIDGLDVEEVKRIVAAHQKAEAENKTALVTELKAAQSVYTDEELNALSIEELEKLKALAVKPKDFSAHNAPRAAEEGDEVPPPPDMWAS